MSNIIFKTFGCKVNQLENDAIRNFYLAKGNAEVKDFTQADVLIINSCAVTHTAENKLVKYIRKGLKNNPQLEVKIFGCFVQNAIERLEKDSPQIRFFNNPAKFKLLGLTMPNLPTMSDHTRTFIKIQEGCNCYCSYCIIPFMRSELFSRPKPEIISNIQQSIRAGVKEIVLVGINLGLWNHEKQKLTDLLADLADIPGNWRLRLSSLEVSDITPELIKIMSNNNKLVPHLHISVQSGSSKIIKSMNRRYTKEEILTKIAQIRENIPLAGLSSDFIVGFPGETEQDFQDSLDVIEKGEFIRVHGFPFSTRPGTKAADMKDTVKQETKKHRQQILSQKSVEVRNKFLQKFLGQKVEVLQEEIKNNKARGYTAEYIPAIITSGKEEMTNTIISGKVNEITSDGELII